MMGRKLYIHPHSISQISKVIISNKQEFQEELGILSQKQPMPSILWGLRILSSKTHIYFCIPLHNMPIYFSMSQLNETSIKTQP